MFCKMGFKEKWPICSKIIVNASLHLDDNYDHASLQAIQQNRKRGKIWNLLYKVMAVPMLTYRCCGCCRHCYVPCEYHKNKIFSIYRKLRWSSWDEWKVVLFVIRLRMKKYGPNQEYIRFVWKEYDLVM